MSRDERNNSPLLFSLTGDWAQYQRKKALDSGSLELISPIYYCYGITAAVRLFHRTQDTVVPITWAIEVCEVFKLTLTPDRIECVYYIGGRHTIFSRHQPGFNNNQLGFFQHFLLP